MNALLTFIFRMLFRQSIRRAREKPKPIAILTYPNEVLIHWPGGRMESLSAAEARERGFEREAEKAEWKQLEKEESEWEEMTPEDLEALRAKIQAYAEWDIVAMPYPGKVHIDWPHGELETLTPAEARKRGFLEEADQAERMLLEEEKKRLEDGGQGNVTDRSGVET